MKLHFSPASPFARKVRVAAAELGLEDKVELVPTRVAPGNPNQEYAARYNPLRRIPALTIDDGTSIIDSKTICEYLDNLDGRGQLVPKGGSRRWKVLSDYAIADGMMELAVLLRYETFLRPEQHRWPDIIEDHFDKISNGLKFFDAKIQASGDKFELSQIALACVLGYLDFRFADYDWRTESPNLAAWHEVIAKRPSYLNTEPA